MCSNLRGPGFLQILSGFFGFGINSKACCLIPFILRREVEYLGMVYAAQRGKTIWALKTICRGELPVFAAFSRTSLANF